MSYRESVIHESVFHDFHPKGLDTFTANLREICMEYLRTNFIVILHQSVWTSLIYAVMQLPAIVHVLVYTL